jgi:hypothetical protein
MTANSAFENVASDVETAITTSNDIHDEMESRSNSENAC